jgi:hypothetical protein
MSIFETVVLDSAGASPLTVQSGTVYDLEQFDPGIAQRRPTWAGGPEADGSLLVVDPPYDDAQGTMTLRIMPAVDTMDAALTALGTLIGKLQECSAAGPDGLACTWTPANATKTWTIYLKLAELDGPPPIEVNGELAGWFLAKPLVKVRFVRAPALEAPPVDTVTEAFGSDTIANFTADAGAVGNVAITGGVMDAAANLTTENRLVRTAGVTYTDLYDSQDTVKFTVGTTVTSFKAGVVVKRIAADTFVEVYVDDNGTNSRLRIDVVTAGVRVNRQSTNLGARVLASTAYWVRVRIEGSTVYAEFWTAAPTPTGTATNAPAGYALAGAEITNFGQGVAGKRGLSFLPMQTAASLDDWVVEPNLWRTPPTATPLLTGTLPGVLGDLAAFTKLIFTDLAAQSRRFIEYGLEQRYYNTATALQIDSGSLVTAGFAGASTTRAGSYNANVIRATLTTNPVTVCSTGPQSHVGTFRVLAHGYASSTSVRVRLSYQEGSGPFRPLDYATPAAAGAFVDLDLGTITIPPALAGTQQWVGRIEALSATVGDTIDIDYLELLPAGEGYSRVAVAQIAETVTAFSARDEFDQTAGALAGKTLPSGGTWTGAGDADDFTVETAGHTAQRALTADTAARYERASTGTHTATLVEADMKFSASVADPQLGVFTRYTDVNNWAAATIVLSGGNVIELVVSKTVAASNTALKREAVALLVATWYTVRLVIDATGRYFAWIFPKGGSPGAPLISGQDSALATGGALASGGYGFLDANTGGNACTRNYDNFLAAVPTDVAALFSGRVAQIRSDVGIRQDSGGTIYGPFPTAPRGSYPQVPPAGAENRTTRIAARALRNNPEDTAVPNVTDALSVQAVVTPRYLAPR